MPKIAGVNHLHAVRVLEKAAVPIHDQKVLVEFAGEQSLRVDPKLGRYPFRHPSRAV